MAESELLSLCRGLRAIGREDHNQKIFAAEKALNESLDENTDADWRAPLSRLRALEAEGQAILAQAPAAAGQGECR